MSKIEYSLASPELGGAKVVDMSADGRWLLQVGPSFTGLFITDAQTGAVRTITTSKVENFSMSPDGRQIAYGISSDSETNAHVWDRVTGADRLLTSYPSNSSASDYVTGMDAGNKVVLFATDRASVSPGSLSEYFKLTSVDLTTGAQRVVYETTPSSDTSLETMALSGDGRFAFVNVYESLVGWSSFRLDLQTGATVPGPDGLGQGASVDVSGDGRYAVFDKLIDGGGATATGVFLKDFATGQERLISTTSSGATLSGINSVPRISADGTKVVFVTSGSELGQPGVVLKDIATGALTFVAAGSPGGISTDGKIIAVTTTDGLVTGDTDGLPDTYLAHFVPPTLAIEKISGDNFVNAAEASKPITVEGTSNAFGQVLKVTAPGGAVVFGKVSAGGVWSVTFDDLSGVREGLRQFSATVLDDAGVRGSANKSAVFDTTKPTLVVLPVAGDNLVNASEAANVTLAGTSDAIGQFVAITLNGEFVGSATVSANGAWSLSLDFTSRPNGFYDYSASVTDAAGNVFTRNVSFDVDSKPPVVSIGAIAGDDVIGAGEADAPVTIRGTSDAIGRTVTLTFNNQVRGTAVVQADGTWAANVNFKGANGDTVVFAEVKDPAGNVGSDAETVLVDSNVIRVSTRADGSQGIENEYGFFGGADFPSASADGRFVVFTGYLLGLVDGESTSHSAIYLKDVLTGDIRIVSSRAGVAPDGQAYAPSISADGRFVAFVSDSSTLVSNDTNRQTGTGLDVFVFDRKTGAYERANTSDAGVQANDTATKTSLYFEKPAFSADGRYVAFTSSATSLAPGVANGSVDFVYIKDRQTGNLSLVSTKADGTPMPESYSPSLSADGRVIAFEQETYDGGVFARRDVYAKNLDTGALTLVSSSASGRPAVYGASDQPYSGGPVISPDGKLVAFYSMADNFANNTPSGFQLFVKNIATGAITLVSPPNGSSSVGLVPGATNFNFNFSKDGRFLAFSTYAAGVAQDVDGKNDVYIRDLKTGTLHLVTPGNVAESYDRSESPVLTADGRYIFYNASSGQLVEGDTNGANDVFLQRLQPGSLTLDPIAGDDRVEAAEAGRALAIAGTSSAIGGTVTIKIDQTAAATATVKADGTWTATFSSLPLTASAHTVTASVRDALGFTSSDGAILTVDQRTSPATRDDDILSGTSGKDTLNGFGGDDTLIGGEEGDTLIGGSGSDTASYAGAKKSVTASLAKSGSNTGDAKGDTYSSVENLAGSRHGDKLTGNGGRNTLSGADGKDTLTGGGGADTFLFSDALSTGKKGRDTLHDFSLKEGDVIALDNDLFGDKLEADGDGHLKAGQFQDLSEGKAGKSDRILYDARHGDLYFDKDGSGTKGADPVLFAHLDAVKGKFAALEADCFLVV